MVGILLSYWGPGLFSGAFAVSFREGKMPFGSQNGTLKYHIKVLLPICFPPSKTLQLQVFPGCELFQISGTLQHPMVPVKYPNQQPSGWTITYITHPTSMFRQNFERFPVSQFWRIPLSTNLQWSWYFRWNSLHIISRAQWGYDGHFCQSWVMSRPRRLRERPLRCNRNDFCPTKRQLVPQVTRWKWSAKLDPDSIILNPCYSTSLGIGTKKTSISRIISIILNYAIQMDGVWVVLFVLMMHCLVVVSTCQIHFQGSKAFQFPTFHGT